MNVTLEHDAADELAELLCLLEDWLMHGGQALRNDLAQFGYRDLFSPDLAVQHLIHQLGHTSLLLRRQLLAAASGARP
jgi:hypothetical protein